MFTSKSPTQWREKVIFTFKNAEIIANNETYALPGAAYLELEAWEDAQPPLERALVLYSELVGEDCVWVADCNACVALVHQQLDEYDESLDRYRQALMIYLKKKGKVCSSL